MPTPNRLSKGDVIVGSLDVDTGISNTDHVDFDTTATSATAVGRIRWDDTDGTIAVGLKGGTVDLSVGQEEVMLVKHADNNGLTKGQVVYFVGSDGTNKTVRLAQANSEATASKTLGVAAETVTGGSKGFLCTFGLIRGMNTSALTEGQVAWLSPSTAGGLTTTKPTAPNHSVMVGFVVRSHANQGALFVSVNNGVELDELHNVLISNPQDGQVLKYEASTGLWKNANP